MSLVWLTCSIFSVFDDCPWPPPYDPACLGLANQEFSLTDMLNRICRRKGRSIFGRENIKKSGCGLCGERVIFFFFFLVSIYGAMPGNVSQLSNQCVDSPLGNYNNTKICLSSWFESNLSNRSQYVVYNNNSSIFFI